MQPSHIALLVFSCVAVGVLLSIFVQHKLASKASDVNNKPSATVLNPRKFSGSSVALAPTVADDPKEAPQALQAPTVDEPVSKAPAGSGKRWTPIK